MTDHNPFNPKDSEQQRYRFKRSQRLSGEKQFAAVYDAKVRKQVGPLLIFGKPNDLGWHRLGLSVSRKVGHAVKRHRIKRLLREAFRLNQHHWAKEESIPNEEYGKQIFYDYVVVVRPHDVEQQHLEDYARMMGTCADRIHQRWTKQKTTKSRPTA